MHVQAHALRLKDYSDNTIQEIMKLRDLIINGELNPKKNTVDNKKLAQFLRELIKTIYVQSNLEYYEEERLEHADEYEHRMHDAS